MKYMKKFSYKLSRVGVMAAIGAATLGACSKDDDDINDVPKQDIEVVFNEDQTARIMSDSIRLILKRPEVGNIYLVPTGYMGWGKENINNLRKRGLEPSMALDPKRVHGRGDFWFYPGNCSVEDSLWFVSKGWTINQKQR